MTRKIATKNDLFNQFFSPHFGGKSDLKKVWQKMKMLNKLFYRSTNA